MGIFGKIIGGSIGFLLGRWVGAAFGAYLGHSYDKYRSFNQGGFGANTFRFESGKVEQETFFKTTFAVMGHVAKAKGQVTKEEIQLATAMMEQMNLNSDQRRAAQDAFREGKDSLFPLEEALQKVRVSSGGRFDLIQFFLELQISAAFADGSLHPRERSVLYKIAEGLGFSSAQLERRLRMQEAAFRFQHQGGFGGQQYQQSQANQHTYSSSHLSDAYDVLGISKDSDAKEIKRAYRKLMNQHHPDKLITKGLPPEMLNVAKEKSQAIQNAYDLIKKTKGFK